MPGGPTIVFELRCKACRCFVRPPGARERGFQRLPVPRHKCRPSLVAVPPNRQPPHVLATTCASRWSPSQLQ
eukprot:6329189-Alexandrium_andersonii.AAC.1